MDALLAALTLVALIAVSGASSTCCKNGWLPYKGSCYYFFDENLLNWNDALTFCKNKDAELVTVETANENRFLVHFAGKLFRNTTHSRVNTMFWLGASDDDIEGIWKWVATDEELNFENWDVSNNQPSSIHDNHEDCLVIKGEYDFMWHDVECDAEHGFPLCEMQGTSTGGTNPLSAIG